MKNVLEIEKRKKTDLQFIISAVTSELHELARLQYFEEWEANGGMGWFFEECVNIANEVMFKEGSQYLKWLDNWSNTDNVLPQMFTGESCFGWYHMNKARELFESRYTKDVDPTEEISEHIGCIINQFDTETQRTNVIDLAVKFAQDNRDRRAKMLVEKKLENIIKELKEIEVDGESMEYIISEVGMTEQMIKQLK